MATNSSLPSQVEVGATPHGEGLIGRVHFLYRRKARTWFGILAPTSLLSAAVLVLADQQNKLIFRSIPRGEIASHFTDVLKAGAFLYGGFSLAWLLGCFALAAIATVVSDLDTDKEEGVWKHDSYQRAREHFGAIFLLAMITFLAFLAGMGVVMFVELTLLRSILRSHWMWTQGISAAGFVLVAAVVSWLGTAIPLILRGQDSVRAALKRSIEVSNGHEIALFLLVVETLAGSYFAWYATVHGLRFILPDSVRHAFWYGWFLTLTGVLASAAVEAPLFLAFAVLADGQNAE